ncbi:MAG: hypothetical protein EXQ77_02390 [Thermoleophilia bacterium]|nr:hypothetical protein [Thermoleophilia bacterium]
MAQPRRPHPAVENLDPAALAAFSADLRRRYSDDEILDELRACARRIARSPTIREFAADKATRVHPQTVIEHFGTWNTAKRAAGLAPRRFIARDELLDQLRRLGAELGRIPNARDLETHRSSVASKSLFWHTFGSLSAALREAGFDVPVGDERLERAVADGAVIARRIGRLPKMADWKFSRLDTPALPSEWQVYRMVGLERGPWAAFQYLIGERLRQEGVSVAADGAVTPPA